MINYDTNNALNHFPSSISVFTAHFFVTPLPLLSTANNFRHPSSSTFEHYLWLICRHTNNTIIIIPFTHTHPPTPQLVGWKSAFILHWIYLGTALIIIAIKCSMIGKQIPSHSHHSPSVRYSLFTPSFLPSCWCRRSANRMRDPIPKD